MAIRKRKEKRKGTISGHDVSRARQQHKLAPVTTRRIFQPDDQERSTTAETASIDAIQKHHENTLSFPAVDFMENPFFPESPSIRFNASA